MKRLLTGLIHRIQSGAPVIVNGRTKALIAALVLLGLVGAYGVLSWSGALAEIMDKEALGRWIERLGVLGPVGIIALMCMAIVLNPIPSAPIALAAGAVYGHFWGTIYVAIGAEAGALTARLAA